MVDMVARHQTFHWHGWDLELTYDGKRRMITPGSFFAHTKAHWRLSINPALQPNSSFQGSGFWAGQKMTRHSQRLKPNSAVANLLAWVHQPSPPSKLVGTPGAPGLWSSVSLTWAICCGQVLGWPFTTWGPLVTVKAAKSRTARPCWQSTARESPTWAKIISWPCRRTQMFTFFVSFHGDSQRVEYDTPQWDVSYVYIYLSVCLSSYLSSYLSIYVYESISIYIYLSLSISFYLYLSLFISTNPSLSLSISFHFYLLSSISIYIYLPL